MATKESLELTESIDNKRYYNIEKDGVLYKLPSITTTISKMSKGLADSITMTNYINSKYKQSINE